MTLPIDIFKIDSDGPRWLQAAASLEEARAHIQKIAGAATGEYLLMNQVTGNKVVLKVNCDVDGNVVAPVKDQTVNAWPAES